MTTIFEPGTREHRFAVLAGMQEMLTFLIEHPEIPLPREVELMVPQIGGTDETRRLLVDSAAAFLGVDPVDKGRHYVARCHFGPHVSYQAFMTPSAEMDRHQALMTYRESVTP